MSLHPRNLSRVRLEVLEDRTTPSSLGLSNLPSAAQAGLAIAAGYNASSQAPDHSPAFQAPTTGATAALASFSLPSTSADGIATAADHNASSQAGIYSNVFQL
jgi:hypothetical protein